MAGLLLCALLGVRYGLGDDVGRRYLGIAPMLLGVLVLGLVTVASARQDGPGPAILVPGVAVSVCLVWWGYRVWRSRPRDSLAETLLAMQAARPRRPPRYGLRKCWDHGGSTSMRPPAR